MINIIKDDTRQNDQSVPKNNVLKVAMKTMRMMNTRIIKIVELPETVKKTFEYFDLTSRMVEAMYEQSPEFLKKCQKNFKFFILNNEPDASQLPLNTNFAFATHSIQNESCAQLLDNDHPHIHVLIEVTKDCVDVVKKMTSTTFVVPCLLSSFNHLILGCSKLHLS